MSDHPFAHPLTDLTADELDKRYADLLSRWQTARRMQMDQNVMYQLDLLLAGIESEKERRAMVDDRPGGVILETDPIKIPTPYKRK